MAVDVVVIGAGVAGLTAGRALAKTRRRFVVLEASDRIGGRTCTDPESGEDLGAAWDHKAKGNRMTAILNKLGAKRVPTFLSRYLFVYDRRLGKSRPASKAELRAFHDAEEKIEARMLKLVASGKDATVAMFLHNVKSKWTRLYMNEAVELDDAAAPTQADVRDTVEFGSGSSDNFIEGGYGAFIATRYGKRVPVQRDTPVAGVDLSVTPPLVTTATGKIYRARKVMTTVSNGILHRSIEPPRGAEHPSFDIRFAPNLPEWKRFAIRGAPMGKFDKIILKFDTTAFMKYGKDEIHENSWVVNDYKGKETMAFVFRPYGMMQIVGFHGGDMDTLGRSDREMVDAALADLNRMLGPGVEKHLVGSKVTRWKENPYTLGSYAYSRPRDISGPFNPREPKSPGEARSRKKKNFHQLMFEPVTGADGANRLFFAGEAAGRNAYLAERYNGSVAGAEYSASDATAQIIRELRAEDKAARVARRSRRAKK